MSVTRRKIRGRQRERERERAKDTDCVTKRGGGEREREREVAGRANERSTIYVCIGGGTRTAVAESERKWNIDR